jgi:hypothetical protein
MFADRLFLPPQPLARQPQALDIAGEQRQVADGPERLVEQLLVGAELVVDAHQARTDLVEQRMLLGRGALGFERAHLFEDLGQLHQAMAARAVDVGLDQARARRPLLGELLELL